MNVLPCKMLDSNAGVRKTVNLFIQKVLITVALPQRPAFVLQLLTCVVLLAIHAYTTYDAQINLYFNFHCIENASKSKQRRTEKNPYGSRSCDEVSWLSFYRQLSGVIHIQGEFTYIITTCMTCDL